MSEPTPRGASRAPSDSDWFEEWFASDYYLKLYSHRDTDEADACIDLILRATGFTEPQQGRRRRALDLASGPGRHAIALARRGFDVTAVDLSPTLLRHAQHEAEEAGVAVDFIESDMRDIEFDGEFDLGVQLFTSFGYFDDEDDDMLVLRHVRTSLRDGGYYALDLINEQHLRRNLVSQSTRSFDGILALEERWIEAGRVNKRIVIPGSRRGSSEHGAHVADEPGASPVNDVRFTETVRLFAPATIERMLRDAGLVPTSWFGDYDGSSYDATDSTRMIVVCRTGGV